jgi:hypothetical protein
LKQRHTPSFGLVALLALAMVAAGALAPVAPLVSTIALAVLGNLLAAELDRSGGAYARWLLKVAAHWLPRGERERRVEEWETDLADAGEEGLRPLLVAWGILLVGAPLLAWAAWRVGQLDGSDRHRNRFAGLPSFVEARATTDQDRFVLRKVLTNLGLLGLVTIFARPVLGASLAAVGLVAAVLLNVGYARALDTKGRPRRRVLGDHLVAAYVAGGLLAPFIGSVAAAAMGIHPVVRFWGFSHTEIEVLLATSSALSITSLLASLADWYYIRPRVDGLVLEPPCRASDRQKMYWKRVTRRWLLYRGFVAFAYTAFVLTVAIVVMGMAVRQYPAGAATIGGLGGLAGLLLILSGGYRSEMPIIARWVLSPAFVLGDDLMFEGLRRPRRGYVLSIAVPAIKLVPLDSKGQPTDVPYMETPTSRLDESELITRSTTACAEKCARLNPECLCDGIDANRRLDRRGRLLIF